MPFKLKTNDEFLKDAFKVHGNKFEYLSPYIKSKEKIKIKCLTCNNIFKQIPNSHLMGNGCLTCAIKIKNQNKTKSNTKFLEESKIIHGNLYEYLEEYKGVNIKIKIKCMLCNDIFLQTPGKHVNSKQGCPICNTGSNGKYNEEYFICRSEEKNIPAKLYLYKIWNENEEFYKVGITRNNKRYFKGEYNSELISEIKTTLYDAWKKEQEFIKKYKEFKYVPNIKFNGHTECFTREIFNV